MSADVYLSDDKTLHVRDFNLWQGLVYNGVYWDPNGATIEGHHYVHVLGMHAMEDAGGAIFKFAGRRYFRGIFGLAAQPGHDHGFGPSSVAGRIRFNFAPGGAFAPPVWEITLNAAIQSSEDVSIRIPELAAEMLLEVDGLRYKECDHSTWANPRYTDTPA